MPSTRSQTVRRLFGTAAALVLLLGARPVAAQDASAVEPRVDQAYSEMIREFTTEPFFLTPLVESLPESDVPTPLDFLGHIVGAPEVLSYPEEIYRYMRALADATPRVKVFSIGTTEEGREMVLVVVSDEENIAALDANKAMLKELGDPRTTSEARAREIIGSAKPIYWSTGAIHSPETGSPEMFMEVVYRLATGESEFIRNIRKNLVFMTTPVIEVDGRAKVVDLAMAERKDSTWSGPSRPLYWGKYVAHDNNRDNIGLALQLSKNVVKTWLEYRPTVFHDHHESASYLYTSTGRGPYNAWLDPILFSEWNRLAFKEVKDMTAFGVPGIYTHDFYDGWGANYMMWVANMRNGLGRFYETQGAGDASNRIVRARVDRQWHRPSTPLPEVVWSIRNNVNLQQSALLLALHEVATNRQEFLTNHWNKAQRSVAKARTEGPAAYVFPAGAPRPGQQARLLRLLQDQGFEVHRTTRDVKVGEREFGEGSWVVRMDQPFSRGADMLLDRQYYNPTDPSPYDDTGWTVGPLFDVETVRVQDVSILDAEMVPVTGPVRDAGGARRASGEDYWLVAYDADNELASFRYAERGLRIEAAERAFEAADRSFPAGSWIVPADGNPADLRDLLDRRGREYGFTAIGVSKAPEVATHPVGAPRVAVMHTWQTTQNEGWLRVGLDEYAIPYDYVSVHDVRDTPRLKDRWDVILFGPSSPDALGIVRGVTGDDPLPWKASEVTPNIGRQASTDDMRGGLELEGVLHLQRFVEEGGVFVTLQNSSSLPVHFGLAPGVRVVQPADLWAPGGVFRVEKKDADHPVTWGYGAELGVYFNRGPIFATGGGGGGFGGFGGGAGAAPDRESPGSTTARRSGRGGLEEQDVVQGRPRDMGQAGVEAFREAQDEDEEPSPFGGASSDAANVRTLFAFPADPTKVLLSGGVRNPQQLAGSPALVDVKLGEGHVLLFGFNPFWRSHTHGAYALVFNALLHHESLGGPAPTPTVTEEATAGR